MQQSSSFDVNLFGFEISQHTSESPDLASSNGLRVFPDIKTTLSGVRFEGTSGSRLFFFHTTVTDTNNYMINVYKDTKNRI